MSSIECINFIFLSRIYLYISYLSSYLNNISSAALRLTSSLKLFYSAAPFDPAIPFISDLLELFRMPDSWIDDLSAETGASLD